MIMTFAFYIWQYVKKCYIFSNVLLGYCSVVNSKIMYVLYLPHNQWDFIINIQHATALKIHNKLLHHNKGSCSKRFWSYHKTEFMHKWDNWCSVTTTVQFMSFPTQIRPLRVVNIKNLYRTLHYWHCMFQYQQEGQRLILTNTDSMMMLQGQVRRALEEHTRMMYVTRNITLQQTRNSASNTAKLHL